ncbi:unnamed protein product [Cochlearia groenlandica]
MISVSSSDGRSGIGLGFGGEIMEESDFEEESTHSYVSCVDPDVALSYIDEKLENVLGHFQKDFEGGVSAENLGSKFGGYGSFLSMYQRSPACKSPSEVHNQVVGRSNCSSSSVAPEVSISGSTSKAPSSDVLVKLKNFVKSSNIGTPDSESKHKPVAKTSSSAPSNQKTLRLRIKVGSSDLSSLKNVSTNSKQGLNMMPSTSRVNCLSVVEEGLLYGIHDSPTKIIMAMVSFPLHKDQLLSPLSDDLIRLGEKERITKDTGYVSVNKSDSNSKPDILCISDAQKYAGKFSTAKKEELRERVKFTPHSSNTENEADKQSCEELVSKTLKLPLLSCLSPSYIHPTKESDKVSDSYVEDDEGTSRRTGKTDIDAALMGSKTRLEDNVAVFPDVYLTEGETLKSPESKSKREKASSSKHGGYSLMDKVSQGEKRNDEQFLKSKVPKPKKSQKSSSRNRMSGKDDVVNIINTNVPDRQPEDGVGSENVYEAFFGDSGESKEEKQSSPVLTAKKQKLSEENVLKESFNAKQSVRGEVKNKHSVEGGMENLGMEPERELSGTCKKPNTGKSRFSSLDQPGSNKTLDVVNKTMVTQASSQKVEDITKASLHVGHNDKKRKLKENGEIGDCMGVREAPITESSEEKFRKEKRLKGSSSDGKELPLSSESCDMDRKVGHENGRDSTSHVTFTASSVSLCKDLGLEIIKTDIQNAKGSLVETPDPSAVRVLDAHELKSGRISERAEHHDTDSNSGHTLKRCRDGEGYSTFDKLGTRKKAAEVFKGNNLPVTGQQATHSRDKERVKDENCSIEKYKPKKSVRHSDDTCSEGESHRKNREGGSSAPSKENNRVTANEVQDLGTAVEKETKESRSKKRPARKLYMESNKEDSKENQDHITKPELNGNHSSSPKQSNREKTSRGRSNHLEVTPDKLKNKLAPHVQVLGHGSEISNTKKQIMKNDNHRRNQKQNGSTHMDHTGSSPLKKESTSQAASNSIKEATALKHMADRLKNAGSNHESTGVYFQAALKFLHGASLWESSGTEHATHKSTAMSRDIYGSTAKLCAFCAHEYEKNKDMGAAALAYKCMEVAYLRITYSSHVNISRYRYELQAALQVIPSGESPSFASDGENSNQTLPAEKEALSNTVRASPKVTGNHVISSGKNSSVSQLLAFTQNVSFAMDASRKAQMAFAASKGKSVDTRYRSEDITCIKRALDFNFQDMEKLLHVVRLAMESINR